MSPSERSALENRFLRIETLIVHGQSGANAMITFLRLSPIFGGKMAFISRTNVIIQNLKKTDSILNKKRQFFSPKFSAKILFKS
jgi:hypothetical protein